MKKVVTSKNYKWDQWIDAAGNLFLNKILMPGSTNVLPDAHATYLLLLTAARAQGAVEIAFNRVSTSQESGDESAGDGLLRIVVETLDAHALLVSASQFWNTLRALQKQIPKLAELSRAMNNTTAVREMTRQAREHVEHLTERTEKGRDSTRSGGEMRVDVFRKAVGQREGTTIVFGDERFDLAEIAKAVKDVGDSVSEALMKAIPMPTCTVTVGDRKKAEEVAPVSVETGENAQSVASDQTTRIGSQPIGPTQHRTSFIGEAKMRFARWFDTAYSDSGLRSKLLAGVEAIARELPQRSHWFEVTSVGLDGGGDLPVQASSDHLRAYPSGEHLAVSTIVPGWGFGWRDVFTDDSVYDILCSFLRYSRQYVHRSRVAQILMVAWEEHSRILHPFGSVVIQQRYGACRPTPSPDVMLDEAVYAMRRESTKDGPEIADQPTQSRWVRRNTLDPWIHQGVFHCLRGHDLHSNEFDVEAVVAFDCAIQSVGNLLTARKRLDGSLTRREVCQHFGLPRASADLAEYAYFVRNNFGAHAGGWRWWDVGEVVDEECARDLGALADTVLSTAADQEPQIRSVDPSPTNWPEWFFEHFQMLWNAVWFEKMDRRGSDQEG